MKTQYPQYFPGMYRSHCSGIANIWELGSTLCRYGISCSSSETWNQSRPVVSLFLNFYQVLVKIYEKNGVFTASFQVTLFVTSWLQTGPNQKHFDFKMQEIVRITTSHSDYWCLLKILYIIWILSWIHFCITCFHIFWLGILRLHFFYHKDNMLRCILFRIVADCTLENIHGFKLTSY